MKPNPALAAVVLAAGLSSRMGQPKMILPWGSTTVLGQVTATLALAAAEIVVVTGGAREQVSAEIQRLGQNLPVREAFNPGYANGQMLLSLQTGLKALQDSPAETTLVALGDQPQVKSITLSGLLQAFAAAPQQVILPSWQNRRGHPWLLPRRLWAEMLSLRPPFTLRDFLQAHAVEILYTQADESVLKDLDTKEEYEEEEMKRRGDEEMRR